MAFLTYNSYLKCESAVKELVNTSSMKTIFLLWGCCVVCCSSESLVYKSNQEHLQGFGGLYQYI